MKTKIQSIFIAVLTTISTMFFVVACGAGGGGIAGIGGSGATPDGGGGGIAGIGGSGVVSSGTVSGFGSVFVNGVEFDTTSATFEIDATAGTQADLDIGMRVSVQGDINADGTTGMADFISYDIDLMGPVSNVMLPDPLVNDGLTRTFETLGITVEVHKFDTLFTLSKNTPALVGKVFDFDNTTGILGGLKNNNHLIINGFFDANGLLHATRIELKNINFDEAADTVITTGTITTINGAILTLTYTNGSTIQVDSSNADMNDLPDGPKINTVIEAKGLLQTASNTILASRLRDATSTLEDTDELELEGIITNFNSSADFEVLGFKVDASSANLTPSSLVLANNLRVEIEGPVVNGILQAEKIEIRGGDATGEVQANISSLSPASNSFVIEPIAGQSLVVSVNATTEFEDDVLEVEPMTFSDLSATDFVRVRGFENETGGITATRVTRREQDKIIVEGRITAGSAVSNSITIFGITFNIDGSSSFEDIDNSTLTQAEFFDTGKAVIGTSIVKIEDKKDSADNEIPDGIADDIELQQL